MFRLQPTRGCDAEQRGALGGGAGGGGGGAGAGVFVVGSQQLPDPEAEPGGWEDLCADWRRTGRGVHSSQQRHSLAAALRSPRGFAAGFDQRNVWNPFAFQTSVVVSSSE